MIFANVKSITIPEGKVKQIAAGSTIIWKSSESSGPSGPAYTNLLPLATDTDRKTIYNGCGYITGKRLSSSGSVSTATGMCASGFIPAKEGDILRIKGTTPKEGTLSYIITYNNSNTKVKNQTIYQDGTWMSQSNSAAPDWQDYDAESDVLVVTLSSDYFGTGFDAIRFSAGVINADTIVTINQEITE